MVMGMRPARLHSRVKNVRGSTAPQIKTAAHGGRWEIHPFI